MRASPRCALDHSTTGTENQHKDTRQAQVGSTAGSGTEGLNAALKNVFHQTMVRTNTPKVLSIVHGADSLKANRKRQISKRESRLPISRNRRDAWKQAVAARKRVCDNNDATANVRVTFGDDEKATFSWVEGETPPWQPVCEWKRGFGACPAVWTPQSTAMPPASLYCSQLSETSGMCSGNSLAQGEPLIPPQPDVVCAAGSKLIAAAKSTPRGDNPQATCCVLTVIAGRCDGNTDEAENVVCPARHKLRANAWKITRQEHKNPTAEAMAKRCCKKKTKAELRADEQEEDGAEDHPDAEIDDDLLEEFEATAREDWSEGMDPAEVAVLEAAQMMVEEDEDAEAAEWGASGEDGQGGAWDAEDEDADL